MLSENTPISIQNLTMWKMTTEDTTTTPAVYESTPTMVAKSISINMQPQGGIANLEADGGIAESVSYKGPVNLALSLSEIMLAVRAKMYGSSYDPTTDVFTDNKKDNAPYFALAYEAETSNGSFKKYVFYKCKAQPLTQNFQTKTPNSVNFATPSLNVVAIADLFSGDTFRVAGPNTTVGANWFTTVYKPTSTPPELTLISLPANNAAAVAIGTKPTLTFSNAISDYAIALIKSSDSSIVPCSISLDSTKKILTITPSANLSAATIYNLVIANIKDVFSQSILPSVIKFTTA